MTLRRRSAVLAGGTSCLAALAALAIATTPASAQRLDVAATGQASALTSVPLAPRPPLGRAAPSGVTPFVHADTPSPWTALKNPPPFGTPGTMLLESDGTVLVHNEPDNNTTGGTNEWYKLTPDSSGSYINGTWSQIASMAAAYTPLYFASAILPDGRMIVEGGEYIGENDAWTDQGAIYNPVTNSWKSVAPPPGWDSIGDAASEVLDNGTFMLQQPCQSCLTDPDFTVDDALLNAKTMKWTVIPGVGKNDPNDEEGWTLEPNGQVLTVDTWIPAATQVFTPSTKSWSFAGNTAVNGNPVDAFPVVEIGPQAELPGGNTFVVGAGSSTQEPPTACTTNAPTQTALYTYKAGVANAWSAGPEIPAIGNQEYDSTDGPAATLPDGNVLFDASACVYNTPTHFFLYNAGSNTLSQIADVPNAPNDSSYYTRMLDLPNGQVLFNDGSNQMEVYTAGGTPEASWAPSISYLSSTTLAPGKTYALAGKQLAGLDQGATYGDDVQNNTNFPVVRITNSATGVVTYARTHDWTSVSVAPGTSSATEFTLPSGTPAGKSTLVVVANGIASSPSTVTIP
ncbi:MAG: hypothetical protein ABSB76_16445 [Streptosporangiaceae bacterium]|jgi:hypothetical protein